MPRLARYPRNLLDRRAQQVRHVGLRDSHRDRPGGFEAGSSAPLRARDCAQALQQTDQFHRDALVCETACSKDPPGAGFSRPSRTYHRRSLGATAQGGGYVCSRRPAGNRSKNMRSVQRKLSSTAAGLCDMPEPVSQDGQRPPDGNMAWGTACLMPPRFAALFDRTSRDVQAEHRTCAIKIGHKSIEHRIAAALPRRHACR